jgi:N-sulfoglucosamine sulfohydrolase
MNRRKLLSLLAAGPAVVKAKDQRPNILFALADDWGWPHARQYGDKVVRTPTFDRVAREGVVFVQAHCCSPSCTPSRGAMLTGQAVHRLEEGGNLWSFLPKKFPVYTDILEQAGYFAGHERKGWGPGSLEGSGRTRNPAGPQFRNFQEFLKSAPGDKPFCYWFGSHDPHRPYEKGSGLASGMDLKGVHIPEFLPDTPEVRSDFLDFYFEVQRYDRETGEILDLIERSGKLDNTIVVMTGDNGIPFPRAKANVYNYGTHQPLAIRWPARIKGGRTIDDFVSFADFAPTFLEAAGLKPLSEMTGRSLLGLLEGRRGAGRDKIFVERERHANVRKDNLSYPMRAVRTKEFLYIRNPRPNRWPAGDPPAFGDVDPSPTKDLILNRREDPAMKKFFGLAFEKRPAEELYDLQKDPGEIRNVAADPRYASAKQKLSAELDRWMKETKDPRATSEDDPWDRYPYFGKRL